MQNPHLNQEWLKKEKAKYYARGESDIWLREYEAQYVFGGRDSVFPMFKNRVHTRPHEVLTGFMGKDLSKLNWYCIADPANCSVFGVLFVAHNPHNGQVFVLDEIYESNRNCTSTTAIWDRVKERKKLLYNKASRWINIYDEAAAWFATEVASHYGEGMMPTRKRLRDKDQDISLIKDIMLAENTLFISENCKNMTWEIENYITDDDGRYIKKNDHLIDCLRYFVDAARYSLNFKPEDNDAPEFRAYTVERDLAERERANDLLQLFDDYDDYLM